MNTHSCNSCQTPFSDRAIFCSNCQDQLRCKDCREILEPKAHFCILCGNPLLVVSRSEGLILATSNPSDVAANKIDFRKTKSGSQRLIASFSDATSSHFSGVLGQVLVAGLGLKERASNTGLADNRETSLQKTLPFFSDKQEGQAPIDNINDSKNAMGEVTAENDGVESNEGESVLRKLFRWDNGQFRLVDKRLGGNNSTRDFVRRLTCLFLYMFETDKKGNVSRESINDILNDNKVYDGNARTWVANSTDLVKYSDGYGLSDSGRDYVKLVLTEIRDNGTTLKPFSSVSKSRNKTTDDSKIVDKDNKEKPPKIVNEKSLKKTQVSSNKRLGPTEILRNLISEKFFSEPRMVSHIISYCRSSLAYNYKASDFSAPLQRLLRTKELQRKTNTEGQYEYYR